MLNELLIARINDTATLCEKTDNFKFLGFLSLEESVLARNILSKRNVSFQVFGGYDSASRVVLCCKPDWAKEISFPITPLTFTFRKTDSLSHRDFLGSLLSIGIKRETVGDILVEQGRAVVFVLNEVADYILEQIKTVGRTGVGVEKGYQLPLPKGDTLAEFSVTVPSLRLDAVVSAICNLSRNDSVIKIEQGFVHVNSLEVSKITKSVSHGDVISVRGKGKFIIVSVSDTTRKKRIILKYKKYV